MPKVFGYMNQSNPLTIGDTEAQEMLNCSIERGWIEYKEYPVDVELPDRKVVLPNGKTLRIMSENTSLSPYNDDGEPGRLYLLSSESATSGEVTPFLPEPDNQIFTSASFGDASVSEITTQSLSASAVANKDTYEISVSGFNPEKSLVSFVLFNSDNLVKDINYRWYYDSATSKIVLTLMNYPHSTGTIQLSVVTYDYKETKEALITKSGTFSYAFTYYDPDMDVESPPYIANFFLSEDNLQSSLYGGKLFHLFGCKMDSSVKTAHPNSYIKIYRLPYGGNEFLYTGLNISSTTGQNIVDRIPDYKLLDILPTEGNTNILFDSGISGSLYDSIMSMVMHNGMLFVAAGKMIYFSDYNNFLSFPAQNFLAFDSNIVGLVIHYSRLIVFTEKNIYIIYGDSPETMYSSKVTFEAQALNVPHSQRSLLGNIYCLNRLTANTSKRTSLFRINTDYGYDIGTKVRDVFNGMTEPSSDQFKNTNRTAILENRYFVAELNRVKSSATTYKHCLVYDSLGGGFCLYLSNYYDGSRKVFKYRTKEFKLSVQTKQAQFMKGISVKAKGSFKVNVYGDNVSIAEIVHDEQDASKPMRIIFQNVPNSRYSTFSIEFIGYEGTQIHDWEVYY